MKLQPILLGLALVTVQAAQAEVIVLREVSMRTFSGTINDGKDHPVMVIDDLKNPRPIGPGRGAGGYVYLNNKLYDWEANQEVGMLHGMCTTLDHGDNGPFKGDVVIGAGGPYPSACQLNYVLEDGTITGLGNIDLNAMELDKTLAIALVGGTGAYRGARGEVRIVQDPPGQPIVYRIELDFDLPRADD